MVITIDGPAGSGKSSTARAVAGRLGFNHLDTGAMYRGVTLFCLEHGIPPQDGETMDSALQTAQLRFHTRDGENRLFLNGTDVSKNIRTARVSEQVSEYSALSSVRTALVQQQREIGAEGNLVCEGRDMGSVVFPEAPLKIYMDATVMERARRRMEQIPLPQRPDMDSLIAEIQRRDSLDSSREISPLIRPEGALVIDTTNLSFAEQVEQITDAATELLENNTEL
ncbi:MAG: (d)CMP kinase [Fibrobacterota bacterium]